jgi:hypothetical protein
MAQQSWEVSHAVATSAGMCALWQPETFAHVTDQDTWEDEVAEDAALVRHMERGAFVPLNAGVGCPFTGLAVSQAPMGVGSQGLPVRAAWMASMARMP